MIEYKVTVVNPVEGHHRIVWYWGAQTHCEHGPAVIDTSMGPEYELWYQYGVLHCETGGAVRGMAEGAADEFWLRGVQYSEEDFKKKLRIMNSCDGDVITHKGKKYKLTLQE